MRLHNRQIKANFWTDYEVKAELDAYGRLFYIGLWQLADDSGCLFDDLSAFKYQLFPDEEAMTKATIEAYRDKLVELGKLVPYTAGGKACLYLANFHKHQALRNAGPPDVPLPSWLTFERSDNRYRGGRYLINNSAVTQRSDSAVTAQSQYCDSTVTVRGSGSYSGSYSGSSGSGPSGSGGTGDLHSEDIQPQPPVKKQSSANADYTPEFEAFWEAFPRKVGKRAAFECWRVRIAEGVTAEAMTVGAVNYAAFCADYETEVNRIQHPSTFLGPKCWYESWQERQVKRKSRDNGDNRAKRGPFADAVGDPEYKAELRRMGLPKPASGRVRVVRRNENV